MKNIGIIVAMQEELEEIQNLMKNVEMKQIYNLTFIQGDIQNKKCVLVRGGIGKVNAARTTQILVDYFELNFVINLGVAGALSPMLEIGDIVIGDKLVQHDFDITAFGHSKGYITGVGDKVFSDSNLVKDFKESVKNIEERDYKVEVGTIASGDIFCTDVAMKDKIYKRFGAYCVEMEGAAIAQVCYLNSVPFIVIRSISDSPNGKNAITFDEFVNLASKRCAIMLEEFLK